MNTKAMNKKDTSIKSNENYIPSEKPNSNLFLEFRKELNLLGKFSILGLYTLLCFSAGYGYFHYEAKEQALDLNDEIKNLSAQIHSIKKNQLKGHELKSLGSFIEGKITSALVARESTAEKIMQQQKGKIKELEGRVFNLLENNNIAAQLKRNISSIGKQNKTIPYNYANLSKLRYEQKLKVNRLDDQLKKEKEAFLSIHNLENPDHHKQWLDLQDQHKITLNNLQQDFLKERNNFRNNKFRVLK